MTDTNRPLWQAMDSAYLKTCRSRGYAPLFPILAARAAEIRAIADEIESPFSDWQKTTSSDLDIIAWLRAEADRAEAGDE